jgi:hypothetical protein
MQRKHREQMSENEIACAEFVAHATTGWTFCNNVHLFERMNNKRITRDDVIGALQSGIVIEVQDGGRIAMRSENGIAAVADLRTKAIVTAWRNAVTDKHSTLDLSDYTWTADIEKFMRRF